MEIWERKLKPIVSLVIFILICGCILIASILCILLRLVICFMGLLESYGRTYSIEDHGIRISGSYFFQEEIYIAFKDISSINTSSSALCELINRGCVLVHKTTPPTAPSVLYKKPKPRPQLIWIKNYQNLYEALITGMRKKNIVDLSKNFELLQQTHRQKVARAILF